MSNKLAHTSVPIHDLLARRWSGRAYDRDKPVTRAQLTALLEAARWAPSCYNDQPWRFIVWDRFRDESSWMRAFDCLGEWNQNWVENAPILILSIARGMFQKTGKPNRWGQHDTGAAGAHLYLQAAAQGLMAHPMGGFDADKALQAFGIPESYTCMAMIAVGHATRADVLNDELKELELAERVRQPLGELFFEDVWDKPFAPG